MPVIQELATVTSKGQITLPKSIRQALGADAGSKLEESVAARNAERAGVRGAIEFKTVDALQRPAPARARGSHAPESAGAWWSECPG